jgi:nucleoside-diphosphate-sugar epimerase
MPNKRVLVSGAGGFIGRWSVPALCAAGYEVHAVLSRTADRVVPPQLAGVHLHVADLLDDSAIDDLVKTVMPTHLLHFAWIATPGVYWTSEENHRWLAASRRLMRVFRASGGVRAMMAGSCAEYDWSRVEVCHELSSPLATGAHATPVYAACKIALQRSLEEFSVGSGLSAAWGRTFFQFGPDEHPDRLVPSVIGNLLMNREAPCSHGRQIRSFLHVADVGAAFAAVLDSELEGPVNIGSGERISVADLIGRVAQQMGRAHLVRLGARVAPEREPAVLVPDVDRLSKEVGWRPRYTLTEGLADTISWWRNRSIAGSSAGYGATNVSAS